jgi:hypothetical protein
MMAGGAPTKYKKNFHPDSVIELIKAGNSVIEVCSKWGIHKDTLNEWNKVHPEFSDALKVARMHLEAWYTQLFKQMAIGKVKGNPAAAIWLSKNVINWSDKFTLADDSEVQFELDE